MRSRNVLFSLLLILVLLAIAAVMRHYEPKRKEAFNRQAGKLTYLHTALCHMQCMGITKAQVKEVMHKGIIIFNKSNRSYRPCPLFALQLRSGGDYLRIIFEQCGNTTKVVQVENIEKAFTCPCGNEN